MPLPSYIQPMLAQIGEPFDSERHLFEIKWDGTRTLCFVEKGAYRLVNRRRIDMTERYPEFEHLARLPSGTVLDGEMVVLRDGKPDFSLLQSREQARSALKFRTLARTQTATYVVFDLLVDRGRSLLEHPLSERRRLLEERLADWRPEHVVLSTGVVGQGKALFREAVAQGLEGIMAKRLDSAYLPGQRTDAWIKIKRGLELVCVIIGFLPSEHRKRDFRSLILAAEEDSKLRCVGKVGSGIGDALRAKLNDFLWTHLMPRPVIPCRDKGKWVEPKLLCRVSCMERSARGDLRAPVFEELLQP